MNIIEKALEKAKIENSVWDLDPLNQTDNLADLTFHEEESVSLVRDPEQPSTKADKEKIVEKKSKSRIIRINWELLKKNGFLTREDAHTQKAEEYRIIKRPLIDNATGKGKKNVHKSNLILVTSSLPGEGKTYSAINLAISTSTEMNKQVLLIDADVARPSIARYLGIKEGIGLIDYLENEQTDFSDIIMETDIPNLRIICAGKQHRHSTELLASNRMVQLSDELSQRYPDRIVIFDTPPLLVASQTHVLVNLVGQVVLVIEAEKTLRSSVMEAAEKLNRCEIVLALLNKDKASTNNVYGSRQYAH
jgi:protein-tyrosine kinase